MKRRMLPVFVVSLAMLLLLLDFTPAVDAIENRIKEKNKEITVVTKQKDASADYIVEEVAESIRTESVESEKTSVGTIIENISMTAIEFDPSECVVSDNEEKRHRKYQIIQCALAGEISEEAKETSTPVMVLEEKGACTIEYAGNELTVTERDFKILCRIVEAEASIEDSIGRQLVANVVLNRVVSVRFPNTIEGVVFDGDAFTSTLNGRYSSVDVEQETIEAVMAVLNGADESQGALYFMNRSTARKKNVKWFDETLVFLFKHGHHEFFTED